MGTVISKKAGDNAPFQRVVVLGVAVEKYQNPPGRSRIGDVAYAEADVNAFVQKLRSIYGSDFDVDVHTLVNDHATLTTIADTAGYLIGGLAESDLFIFFYAGHGFHGAGDNRLTAYDSNLDNLANTTLNFQSTVLDRLKTSACRRALLFIDACAETLAETAIGRSALGSINLDEIERALDESDYLAVFLSCSPGEKSYSTSALSHGVFTAHLLRALGGEAEEALEHDRWLTDVGLRNYLRTSVRGYVTKHMTVAGHQTPRAIVNAQQSFRIRHVAAKAAAPSVALADLRLVNRDAYLEGVETGAIRSLNDFSRDRGNTVPKTHSSSVDAWVGRMLAERISAELDNLKALAKKVLGLRRNDAPIELDDGSGSLDTPYFRYAIMCDQNPGDVAEWRIRRHLTLRDGWEEARDGIEEVFAGTDFQHLVVDIDASKARFDDLADALEALADQTGGQFDEQTREKRLCFETEQVRLTIDLKAARVELRIDADSNLEIVERARGLSLGWRHPSPLLPPPAASNSEPARTLVKAKAAVLTRTRRR